MTNARLGYIKVGQQKFCRFFTVGLRESDMVTRIPAQERHFVDLSWMQAYWLFSYGEWFVPDNVRLGMLRAFHDALIQSRECFGTHLHEELEIGTIMLMGQLTITDDAGQRTTIHAGEVHRISTGTGTRHMEKNEESDPARYYQIWIFPDKPGADTIARAEGLHADVAAGPV